MTQKFKCIHLSTVTGTPVNEIISSTDVEEFTCDDCNGSGPNLWMCLHSDCLKVGCSEKFNDHNTRHNEENPSHAVHLNLTTNRLWCYICENEVFMDAETSDVRWHDFPEDLADDDEAKECDDRGQSNNEECEASSSSSSSSCGLVGLQNIGNTCYMNAALQALSNTIPLRNFFLECTPIVHMLTENRKMSLSRIYQVLIRDMWVKKSCGYVTPSGILYGIRSVHAMFRGFHQHDTQEFLRNFMDQLHEELKQSEYAHVSPISTAALEDATLNSSHESSEGEYETCDSGVGERSSLSEEEEEEREPFLGSLKQKKTFRSNRLGHRMSSSSSSTSSVGDAAAAAAGDYHDMISAPFVSIGKKQLQYRSIISDIFDGKLLSSVQCLTCNRISSRIETFQDLSLPIPSRDHLAVLHERNANFNSGGTCAEVVLPTDNDGWFSWIVSILRSWFYGPTVSLHECLSAFFSTDELKGDNMYSCERCNKLRNGIKFSKVLQLPEVLCIHLKRFRHELLFSSKISSYVSFPLKVLDMGVYLHKDCVSNVTTYELYAVICHHGTAGGGHYTCYCLNGDDGHWYEYDDQYVTRVNVETVRTCEAYVLFYRKAIAAAQHFRDRVCQLADRVRGGGYDHHRNTYISKQWLNKFKTCSEPGPIDNSDYLCKHGLLRSERAALLDDLAVVLPKSVYDYLHDTFGGCPSSRVVDQTCAVCANVDARLVGESELYLQLKRDNCSVPLTHLISAEWYQQWLNFVQRRSCEPPGSIDNSKSMVAVEDDECTAVEITEQMWRFFHSIYGGGPEVSINENQLDAKRTISCNGDKRVYHRGEQQTTIDSIGDDDRLDRSNSAGSDGCEKPLQVQHQPKSNVE